MYTLVFLGYGPESQTPVLELTYNEGVNSYDLGNAFGHIAIEVEDCHKACAEINAKGGRICLEAVPFDSGRETIAFVSDPDGYQIELIERPTD